MSYRQCSYGHSWTVNQRVVRSCAIQPRRFLWGVERPCAQALEVLPLIDVGVQIFDPTGRLCGVLPAPQPAKPLTSCALAGQNLEYLYVTNGDKIFRRKVQAKAK